MFDRDAALRKVVDEAYRHRSGSRATILVPDRLGPAGGLEAARQVLGYSDVELVRVKSVGGAAYLTYEAPTR